MNKYRVAFIVIKYPDNKILHDKISVVLDKYKEKILNIKQIFDKHDRKFIISILAKITTDELGAITGPLGKLDGVKLKSGVLPK